MKQNPKHSHAIAYLRQLCCSGLAKEIVIPEFLRAVKAVIPSHNIVFTGTDDKLGITYFMLESVPDDFFETSASVLGQYFTPERILPFNGWLQTHPVLTNPAIFDKALYKSDVYNLVYCAYDQHHILSSLVLDQGKPFGILNLYRPVKLKPFNSREQALCLQLLPYLVNACGEGVKDIQYGESGLPGMMVMDTQGQILYLTDEARGLLALACHPVLSFDALSQEAHILMQLSQLCRNLQAVFKGKYTPPPSWCHTNGRGRFTFRAFWLERQNQQPDRLISITIEHQEPLVVKILRGLHGLPLSPVQKQVALLLAQGLANEVIGEHLHIKLSTVKEHVSKIFDKLGIYRRDELMPYLLAVDKGRVAWLDC
jgi:DNA-binding CsgD family transcriptional regulator